MYAAAAGLLTFALLSVINCFTLGMYTMSPVFFLHRNSRMLSVFFWIVGRIAITSTSPSATTKNVLRSLQGSWGYTV